MGGFCLVGLVLFWNIGVNISHIREGTNKWFVTLLGRMLLKNLGKMLLLADTGCFSVLSKNIGDKMETYKTDVHIDACIDLMCMFMIMMIRKMYKTQI